MKTRTPFHHGNLRNALIQSGLEILAQQGIQALSLRKVAKAAGVSEAAPYRHFKDKEALLAAIAEQGFIRLSERLESVEEQYSEDATALFYQSCLTYIAFARANPHSMRIMFRFRQDRGLSNYPELRDASDEAFSYLIDMVEYCQHEGIARDGHPLPLALSAWSTIHGLSMLLIDGCIAPDVFQENNEERMIQTTLDTLLAGWKHAPISPHA